MSFLKRIIIRRIYRPILVKKYTKWYLETRNWTKNDWKNWLAEEFEKSKRTKWTLRNYPELMNYTMEDMVGYPVSDEYKDYPEDYPAVITTFSTGTIRKKIVKWTKEDMIKNFMIFGRATWWLKGESRYKNILLLGSAGVMSGVGTKYAIDFLASRGIADDFEHAINNFDAIKRKGPYDLIFIGLPHIFTFIKKINENIFYNPSFILLSGDRITTHIRKSIEKLGKKLNTLLCTVDFYSCTEGGILAFEIPTKMPRCDIYFPELHLGFIRKENGELVNILDAKKGTVGEYVITTLQKYMIPNLRLFDIVEVVEESSPLGLPAIKILGRKAHKEIIETETLGEIRGISGVNLRVKGIIFNDYYLTEFIEREFDMKHLILLEEKEDYVIMRIYCEKKIQRDEFLEKLEKDENTGYLINDLKNEVLKIELIYDPEVIKEFENKIYSVRGRQATIPRLILIEGES